MIKRCPGTETERAAALGLELLDLGLKDVVLPGEMKALLNRVAISAPAFGLRPPRAKPAPPAQLVSAMWPSSSSAQVRGSLWNSPSSAITAKRGWGWRGAP